MTQKGSKKKKNAASQIYKSDPNSRQSRGVFTESDTSGVIIEDEKLITDNQAFHHVPPCSPNSADDSPDQRVNRIKSNRLDLVGESP